MGGLRVGNGCFDRYVIPNIMDAAMLWHRDGNLRLSDRKMPNAFAIVYETGKITILFHILADILHPDIRPAVNVIRGRLFVPVKQRQCPTVGVKHFIIWGISKETLWILEGKSLPNRRVYGRVAFGARVEHTTEISVRQFHAHGIG
jgi:hypothetical protein